MSLLSFTKKIVGQGGSKKPPATSPTEQPVEKKAASSAPISVIAGRINLTPLVTEKSVSAQGSANVVVFKVSATATKGQVAAAISSRYQITPRSIRSLRLKPKVRRRGHTSGLTNVWKKVYVTLPAGQTIDLSV